ncbi:MAG: hypothetical protein KIT31_12640 [Deltaproteobacteria bacterium]|nr:hypothetical protein [Deltaproteobacteria bacterium]
MSNDHLFITPIIGHFDVDCAKAWLDARPDAVEVVPNDYRFESAPIHADEGYVESLAGHYGSGTYVRLSPHRIVVVNDGSIRSLHGVYEFVLWLSSEYAVRLGEGWEGERPVELERVYPEDVRTLTPAWKHELIEIGFFRYLSDGQETSVSVDEARREAPVPEEAELLAYLEAGHLYRGADELARDASGDVIALAEVYTDGRYVWPAHLPMHVRRDHVRLPRHFMIHARANGWRVPSVDLAALPGSPNVAAPSAEERARYARAPEPGAITVAHGLVTLGPLLRAGAADAVYRGFTRRGSPVLVTLTMRHDDAYFELEIRLAYPVDGIAKLLYVGEADDATGFRDVLVEREPAGRSLLDRAPMPEAAAIRCGIAAAGVVAQAHEAGYLLGGLAPEVIYAADDGTFTGLTPRSRRFVADVELRSGGLRSYKLPYSGHESLVLGHPSFEEADVFALGASLFHAVTGTHPFGAQFPDILQRITAKVPLPFTGSPALGALLARCLAPDPRARPTATELAAELAKLA